MEWLPSRAGPVVSWRISPPRHLQGAPRGGPTSPGLPSQGRCPQVPRDATPDGVIYDLSGTPCASLSSPVKGGVTVASVTSGSPDARQLLSTRQASGVLMTSSLFDEAPVYLESLFSAAEKQ